MPRQPQVDELEVALPLTTYPLHYLLHTTHYQVHRDLKPENLVLDAEGYLKLVDLGLARQHGQSAPWAAPQLGSCASSGRAWRLRAAPHSQEEADPLGAQPLPRVLERAASIAAHFTAFDHSGAASWVPRVAASLISADRDTFRVNCYRPPE